MEEENEELNPSSYSEQEPRKKSGAGSVAKGAVKGGAKGAAKGAVKEGIKGGAKEGAKGAKKGAEVGAKIGGSIPYVGAVTGAIGGGIGAAVGGVGGFAYGATKDGTKGAIKEGAKGAKDGAEEEAEKQMQNSDNKKSSIRDNLLQLAKKAIRGDKKAVLLLKIKSGIYIVLAVLVFFALIIEGNAEDTSKQATSSTATVYVNSTTESANMYNTTGSLILSTDEEIQQSVTNYLDQLKNTNEGYYDALSTKYSGKESSTVANKVKHITSNFEANETKEVDVITGSASVIAGATTPKDEKTIYEHILNTEKYNFNNIIWRSYEKSGGSLVTANINFRVDDASNLKYPVSDPNAINNDDLDLEFFITKVRPYLQSWYIPFDIMIGTQDAQDGTNLNTDLAYEILTSAYHEIVLDRYKLEKLSRRTNYLVYDKITEVETTTRSCATYKFDSTQIEKQKGYACTKEDYDKGLCKDYVMQVMKVVTVACNDKFENCLRDDNGKPVKSKRTTVQCKDNWVNGCSYGVLKQDITVTTSSNQTYCVDTTTTSTNEEKDIRESKVKNTRDTDTLTYSWNYVITMAKMFDKVISNKYNFTPYYQYPLDNYNKFIKRKDEYANMTVEDFRTSEQTISQADDFTFEELDYNEVEPPKTDNTNSSWNSNYVVSSIPQGGTIVGTPTTKVVKKVTNVTKTGKEYIDKYNWSDNLNFEETKSGIYNVDSVKDVTGDDLTPSDTTYYNDLYMDKDVNIIDLMNSNKDIYSKYLSAYDQSTTSSNIGIRKSALGISYNVLEKDLKELAEKYPLSGLMYGNSFDILEGLNLGMVSSASGVNDAMLMVAEAHLGYDLDQMLALNHKGTFFRNHWCAMFVSYCMRTVEDKTGINIPIPNYAGCTTFWRNYNSKPGFFDVQEWVTANQFGECVQSDPTHIAPLSSIQPGDIIFYCWTSAGDRDHTAVVKSVERDASGNVTKIVSIDGNWGGSGRGEPSYNYSSVKYAEHSAGSTNAYTSLSSIASFVSVSTVQAEAERGNIW